MEQPIPEQFKTTINGTKLNTAIAESVWAEETNKKAKNLKILFWGSEIHNLCNSILDFLFLIILWLLKIAVINFALKVSVLFYFIVSGNKSLENDPPTFFDLLFSKRPASLKVHCN